MSDNLDLELIKRLEFPKGKVDVILDTDAYNEIDDQFAISYMIKSPEKINTIALYAAPFHNQKSDSPKDGMEKSYDEIIKLLKLMNETQIPVFKGSEEFLTDEKTPVISDAANDLAKRAMNYSKEKPLYVVAIGAITNIASAILINPEIADKIVVVWLGGHATHWIHNRAFNCYQDVASARVIFDAKLALVHLPCQGAVSIFRVGKQELIHNLKGKNPLCDYLLEYSVFTGEDESDVDTWTRVIWDVAAVAWLVDEKFLLSSLEHTPIPQYDHYFSESKLRHLCRTVYYVDRDALFNDLFKKLGKN